MSSRLFDKQFGGCSFYFWQVYMFLTKNIKKGLAWKTDMCYHASGIEQLNEIKTIGGGVYIQ